MVQQPAVWILVLNYCSLDDTLACVASIRRIDYPNLRLLVMDNASPDGSGDVLRANLPDDEFLQIAENTGYAGGNNAGVRIALSAGADYVLIMNPDVRLAPVSIKEYVRIMETDGAISALNPIQIDSAGKIDAFFQREVFDGNQYAVPELPTSGQELWEVKALFGAALFVRRRTLETIGGFDPLYFAYWEEMDLCRRIRFHGGRMVVTGASPVRHLRSYLNGPVSERRQFLRLKGKYLFQLKDFTKPLVRQMRATVRELLVLAFRGEKGQFNWSRWQYLKVLGWCVVHLPRIRAHRNLEMRGRAHI